MSLLIFLDTFEFFWEVSYNSENTVFEKKFEAI